MKTKLFNSSQFTPTKWDTNEQKAKFANHFVSFVESDFKRTKFPKWFYNRLSSCFGHIAHYDLLGFYSTFFENNKSKVEFLEHCLKGGGYGSPEFTYSDVERALQTWLTENDILHKYQKM